MFVVVDGSLRVEGEIEPAVLCQNTPEALREAFDVAHENRRAFPARQQLSVARPEKNASGYREARTLIKALWC